MSDELDALFDEGQSEPVTKPDVAQEPSQPRDDSGRFATKAVEAPAQATVVEVTPTAPVVPQASPEPAKPAQAEPGHIPISALLDEREKRQALQREVESLRSQKQQEPSPSIHDPESYQAWVNSQFTRIETGTRFNISEALSRREHGDSTVDSAMEWGQNRAETEKARYGSSPFADEFIRQQFPIDWVVRQHKRDALLTEIGDDPAAYRARILAEAQAQAPAPALQPAAQPQQAAPRTPTPTRSLASTPNAGGGTQFVPHVDPFDAVFSK